MILYLKNKNKTKVSQMKVVGLISGGIDSPVASALMVRNEFEVLPLHFCIYPFTCEESFKRVIEIFKNLQPKLGFNKVIMYPWAEVLSTISNYAPKDSYRCLLCRKSMYKVAEKICDQNNAAGIVTGEALGQKASQTLSNLTAVSYGIRYPIFRPLIGLDKSEIITLARKLGIYEEHHASCCSAIPRKPAVEMNAQLLDKMWNELGFQKVIEKNFEKVFEMQRFDEDIGTLLELVLT